MTNNWSQTLWASMKEDKHVKNQGPYVLKHFLGTVTVSTRFYQLQFFLSDFILSNSQINNQTFKNNRNHMNSINVAFSLKTEELFCSFFVWQHKTILYRKND